MSSTDRALLRHAEILTDGQTHSLTAITIALVALERHIRSGCPPDDLADTLAEIRSEAEVILRATSALDRRLTEHLGTNETAALRAPHFRVVDAESRSPQHRTPQTG